MILSRFWYLALGAALAAAVFVLFLATAIVNRSAQSTADKLLLAQSKAVGKSLEVDSRRRAEKLIELSVNGDVQKALGESNKVEKLAELDKVDKNLRSKAEAALRVFRKKMMSGDTPFDALWAINVHGRVVASDNFERGTDSEHYEMGGYALVADALHGWIRDDAWVFNGQVYRVVGHPVEIEVQGSPVGAIVGAKIVDHALAQSISDDTGAAVAFYAGGTRIAAGAPVSFDKGRLEVTGADLTEVEKDENYKTQGRSSPMLLRQTGNEAVSFMFARLPGEAGVIGAGYVVGHMQLTVPDPLAFTDERIQKETDKQAVPMWLVVAVALGGALIGLILSLFEHTMPIASFRKAVAELAEKGTHTDALKPSTFRGPFKKIAILVNDALDRVAASSGVERGPADLERVLGPLPSAPQMSAFSVPQSGMQSGLSRSQAGIATSGERQRSLPKAPVKEGSPTSSRTADAGGQTLPSNDGGASAAGEPSVLASVELSGEVARAAVGAAPVDEETEWRGVYGEFVTLKKQLGEDVAKLTYEKFRGTLQRNKEALVARHGCSRVKFRVYEKQGRAALKASPVKDA